MSDLAARIEFAAKGHAVRRACKDALDKGKLGVVAAIHSVPEGKLREFVAGDDSALTPSQIEWLAVDLRT